MEEEISQYFQVQSPWNQSSDSIIEKYVKPKDKDHFLGDYLVNQVLDYPKIEAIFFSIHDEDFKFIFIYLIHQFTCR